MGARVELHGHDAGPPHTPAGALSALKKSLAGRCRTGCFGSGRRNRFCSRLSMQFLWCRFLDDPAPQIVEQLPDVLQFFDAIMPDPEQVIEVPKILPDDVTMRTTVRDTQLAEQLVEVPTIVSWSLLQLIMEQNVNIPVPGRGRRSAGLKGFLPGQSSTMLHVSQERISERIVDQIVDFTVSGGGLQDFRPGQSFILFFARSSSCS